MTTTPPAPRSSRRNHPSLSHLQLAPLSTFTSETSHVDEGSASGTRTPPWRQSYIAGKSAPTTPSIFSRSPSRTRAKNASNSKSYTQLPFTDNLERGLRRGKSSRSTGKKTASTPHPRDDVGGEWLFRAGTAISDEARLSKGQAWLVNRASSTSLVDQADPQDSDSDDNRTGAGNTPRILSPDTDRRHFARSARTSRSASRADIAGMAMTAPGTQSRASRTSLYSGGEPDDYFSARRDRSRGGATPGPGPDFVDGTDEDEDDDRDDADAHDSGSDSPEQQAADEAEIARLARARTGVLDSVLGWALSGDGADSDADDDAAAAEAEDAASRAALGKLRNARAAAAQAPVGPRAQADADGVSAWTDAAWLLSVASKVLF